MVSIAMEHGVRLSRTSPAFLHANSTSHTWIFSAIAELIDNAYDPDVGASCLRIDAIDFGTMTCLVFTDDGNGMTAEKLHNMLSFGFCEKDDIKAPYKPVGQYGNGFKSGSMRLGKDALVFTKGRKTCNVGFLSQTFLECIGASTVLVPIISFNKDTMELVDNREDTIGSIQCITQYSLFKSMDEIREQFKLFGNAENRGTRIIIYNLSKSTDGMLELDFKSDALDIINPEHHAFDQTIGSVRQAREYVPEYRRSLREYCSILFLKPRMKIIIRGEKVKTKLISKCLKSREIDWYKPKYLKQTVQMVFGFNTNMDDYGLMLYHRNRLIKAYEKVGCQKQANDVGKGVVGVIEVDFLEPIHNKQDFNKTDRYNAAMTTFAAKLNDFWFVKTNQPQESQPENSSAKVDWTWAQCDNPKCLKWRRLPNSVSADSLPQKWFCYMNLDATHNRCDIPEEPEDEDALLQQRASFRETLKQKKKSIEDNRKELQKEQKEKENGINGIAIARMEAELEESRKREERQRHIIAQLEQQKEKWADSQKHFSQIISSRFASAPPTIVPAIPPVSTVQATVPTVPVAIPRVHSTVPPVPSTVLTAVPIVVEPACNTGSTIANTTVSQRNGQLAAGNSVSNAGPGPVASTSMASIPPVSSSNISMPPPAASTSFHQSNNNNNNVNVDDDDEDIKDIKPSPTLLFRVGKKRSHAESAPIIIDSDEDDDDGKVVDVQTSKKKSKQSTLTSPTPSQTTTASQVSSASSAPNHTKSTKKSRSVASFSRPKSISDDNESSAASPGVSVNLSGYTGRRSSSGTDYIPLTMNDNNEPVTVELVGNTARKVARQGENIASTSGEGRSRIRHYCDSSIQTDKVEENCSSCADKRRVERKLRSLRGNVARLLKTILPELECNDKDLEYVDDVIVEMIKVNVDSGSST